MSTRSDVLKSANAAIELRKKLAHLSTVARMAADMGAPAFKFVQTDERGVESTRARRINNVRSVFMDRRDAERFCNLLECYLRMEFRDSYRMSWDQRRAVMSFLTGEYTQYASSSRRIEDMLPELGMWWENQGVDFSFVPMFVTTEHGYVKRLANNNARNLLHYPDICIEIVRNDWMPALESRLGVNIHFSRKRAFLYVVADRYVHLNTVVDEPVVLLLAHGGNSGGPTLWGVAGGEQEASDQGGSVCPLRAFSVNAKREFAEEFLNIDAKTVRGGVSAKEAQKGALEAILDKTNISRPMERFYVSRDRTMAGFRVSFKSSLALEEIASRFNARINPTASRTTQRQTRLSSEIVGFAWVAKSQVVRAATASQPPLDAHGNLLVTDTGGAQLAVRPYVFGRRGRRSGRWKPNASLANLFK